MPKYTGIDGEVREITSQYTGVNGEVREIKEEFCGINGEVRQIFGGMKDLVQALGGKVTWYGGYYEESTGRLLYYDTANTSYDTTYSGISDDGIYFYGTETYADSSRKYGFMMLEFDATNINTITVNYTPSGTTTSRKKIHYKIHKKSATTFNNAMMSINTSGNSSLTSSGETIDVSSYNEVIYLPLWNGGTAVGGVTATIHEMIIG